MKAKLALTAFSLMLILCGRKEVSDERAAGWEPADTNRVLSLQEELSYSEIYGIYRHESNGTGFFAEIEIKPMGNDLQFALSLKQPECEWELQGTLAMMYHLEDEYAGFYDSETCRLVFTFFLSLNQIRLDQAGICVALPARCSPGGVYRKADKPM